MHDEQLIKVVEERSIRHGAATTSHRFKINEKPDEEEKTENSEA